MSGEGELGPPGNRANGEEDDVGRVSDEESDDELVMLNWDWKDPEKNRFNSQYDHPNSRYDHANSRYDHANSRYDRADSRYDLNCDYEEDDLFPENPFVILSHSSDLEEDSDVSLICERDSEPSPLHDYSLAGGGNEFLASMWDLTQEAHFTDIEIEFKGGETLRSSRLVLASMSDYFKNMLSTAMQETLEGKIKLQTTSLRTFNYILAYSMGRPQELQGREEVYDVLEQADMMQMQELTQKCLQLLTRKLSPAVALETYFAIDSYEYPKEKKYVLEYIHEHISTISKWEDFISLEEEELLSVMDTLFEGLAYDDVLKAVVKWINARNAEPDCVVRLVSKVLTAKMGVETIVRQVLGNLILWQNEDVRKLVHEKLSSLGRVCLLAIGGNIRAGQSQSPLHAWIERDQEWVIPPNVDDVDCLPSLHSSFASDDFYLYVTGGESRGTPRASTWIMSLVCAPKGQMCAGDPMMEQKSSIVKDSVCANCGLPQVPAICDFDRWRKPGTCSCWSWQSHLMSPIPFAVNVPSKAFAARAGNLNVPRMQHGSAVVYKQLFVAGGLPGPLSSVEKLACKPICRWHVVGDLPNAVCRCTAGGVGGCLLVVGYPTEVCEQPIIQSFNTETMCGQVITLDGGPCSYLLPVRGPGSLHCLRADGAFLELVEGPSGAVEVKCATQLQDFQVPAPFRAFFDGADLLVFDISCSPVKVEMYSPDGKKTFKDSPFLQLPQWSDVVGLAWGFLGKRHLPGFYHLGVI